MKVLIDCEFSGIIREEFRKRGHDAWSCDLLDSEIPGQHIKRDCREIDHSKFDLWIAHPPCTDLAVSGARWFKDKQKQQLESIEFFLWFTKLGGNGMIENPIGIMSRLYRKPDQIIQPYQFGHPETKATCLWLFGDLPKLKPTNIVMPLFHTVHREPPSPDRWKNSSRTFTGIAQAIAEQWGETLPQEKLNE